MSIQKKIDDKENAVSPVVGVMLMLVVTIIIAAVVAVFATGVVTTTQTAPTAVLSAGDFKVQTLGVEPYQNDYLTELKLVHKNGDTLAIDNLELQTFAFGSTQKYDATKMTSALRSNAISAGDSIIIDVSGCYYSTGTPVEWKLVDTASGMGICSGKFVVPVKNYTPPTSGGDDNPDAS